MENYRKTDQDLIQTYHLSETLDALAVQIRLIEFNYGTKDHLIQLKRELQRIRLLIKLTKALPQTKKLGLIEMEWE